MSKISKELIKLAKMIVADDYEYRYDPDHKMKPSGGGWTKTESGWSKQKEEKSKETKETFEPKKQINKDPVTKTLADGRATMTYDPKDRTFDVHDRSAGWMNDGLHPLHMYKLSKKHFDSFDDFKKEFGIDSIDDISDSDKYGIVFGGRGGYSYFTDLVYNREEERPDEVEVIKETYDVDDKTAKKIFDLSVSEVSIDDNKAAANIFHRIYGENPTIDDIGKKMDELKNDSHYDEIDAFVDEADEIFFNQIDYDKAYEKVMGKPFDHKAKELEKSRWKSQSDLPSDKKPKEKKPITYKKLSPKKDTLAPVQNILKFHKLNNDSDEVKELAGFKKSIEKNQRLTQDAVKKKKEQGDKFWPRNAQKLKSEFIKNMDMSNYSSSEAFENAKKRLQRMPAQDFAKILAAISAEGDEIV